MSNVDLIANEEKLRQETQLVFEHYETHRQEFVKTIIALVMSLEMLSNVSRQTH